MVDYGMISANPAPSVSVLPFSSLVMDLTVPIFFNTGLRYDFFVVVACKFIVFMLKLLIEFTSIRVKSTYII